MARRFRNGDRPLNFEPDPAVLALRARVRDFVEREVIPREPEIAAEPARLGPIVQALRASARDAGLYLPHLPASLGGLGLSWVATAAVLEEAGRSLFGPHALNAAAPDEGNMHLLERVASPEQRSRWLEPLARGDIRSCFAMTEPAPGAGADPSLLATRATRDARGRWVLQGRKWFVTGVDGAAFALVLARAPEGPTLFIVPTDAPGFRIVRTIPTLDHLTPGGHGQVELEDCVVDPDAGAGLVGEAGQGFEYAQLRLEPARLTHCMRWLGVAVRSMEIATDYARRRESFGAKLAEHQGVQTQVADSYIEIHAARLMVLHAAWKLDRGERVRHESSMAKVFVAETVGRVVDRAVQICGALGISGDVPLGMFYREVRPFRIYDGPSEVHRASIARRVFTRRLAP